MDPERRRRIEAFFEEVVDRPPTAREARLGELAATDPAIADGVRALLAAHERAAGILEQDAVAAARTVLDPNPLRGRRIGAYRVERELGRGGMGVVYLAERDDGQFRRRVAIKLLRGGPDAGEVLRRFAAERQILASLNHPHIAQLIDGGVSEGQVPYLVMEYVDGLPITEYADQQRLDINARLRLFRQVCDAVHHAHQNLILHRDLKPGNVLVTARGEVKLLDFGIAKLLNPALAAADAPATRTEFRVLTPEYASPEQVRGAPLSTASDVYSLGVVLYQLLTGQRPYRLTTASPQELTTVVLEREPERPSERVRRVDPAGSGPPTDQERIAAARNLTPERLSRRLGGDLDAIVMMALRKEPTRRYGTATLLSQDIQRHLDGLPVAAHRGSRVYHLRRFVARHRASVATAVIAVTAVVGGAALALRQAAVADAERERAEQALTRLEESLRRSEAVTGILTNLFESAGPDASPGDTVTPRQLLRAGMEQVTQLSAQPLVQASILDAMARLHSRLAEYSQARELLERSLAVQESAGEGPVGTARTRWFLADVLRRQGEYPAAEQTVRHGLAELTRIGAAQHSGAADLFIQLGSILVYRGALAEAESLAVQALAIRRDMQPPDDSLVAKALEHLAALRRRRANVAGAAAALREAIEIRQRTFGENDLGLATALQRLADLQGEDYGRMAVAESLYRRSWEIHRRVLGDSHPWTAWAATHVARVLGWRGEHAAAEGVYRETLALAQRVYGRDHPLVGEMMGALADAVWRAGRRDEAMQLAREATEVWRRSLGEQHAAYAGALVRLGDMMSQAGQYAEADRLLVRGLAIRRAAVGLENPTVGLGRAVYAAHLARQSRFAAADSVYRDALAIVLREVPGTHRDVRGIYAGMAGMYRAWGRLDQAEHYARLSGPP